MHLTQTPHITKTMTHILKSSPTKRGFFSIENVLPPESKKPYTYVTPRHITASGHTVLDNFYQITEEFRDKTHLTEDKITKKLNQSNCLNKLTGTLRKNNPDFVINFLGVYLRPENQVFLHNDKEIKEEDNADLVVILPIHQEDKQTLFFDNNQIFKKLPNHKNFYRVKKSKKDDFLEDLSKAQKNIPNNAIASLFYINDKYGNPVIHCGPFDATHTVITDSVANAIPIDTEESNNKRCFIAWTIEHENNTLIPY